MPVHLFRCHSQAPKLPQGCLHQGENNGIAGSPINTARQKPVNWQYQEIPLGSRLRSPGSRTRCIWAFSVNLSRTKWSDRFPATESKAGILMERLIEKVSKVVNSCVTPQQLEVAENFAERAKTKMKPDEWLDIASVINIKANKILFCSVEDLEILGKVWSRL